MTVATAAVGAIAGRASGPRLALPGAVLLLAGGALVYWGTGIFRGETGSGGWGVGSGPGKQIYNPGGAGKIGSKGAPLSSAQVAKIASDAGFKGDSLRTALAVARGESGWISDALGDVNIQSGDWGPSVGLFQIRCLKSQIGTGKERDCDALLDPEFNARSAFKISNGGRNWQPWTVFNTGAYRQHLDNAVAAINGMLRSGGGGDARLM